MMKKELNGLTNLKRNKMTAVEWLIEQLIPKDQHEGIMDIIEEAKEIEKEQIIKARATARRLGALGGAHYLSEADEYYNETFKSE